MYMNYMCNNSSQIKQDLKLDPEAITLMVPVHSVQTAKTPHVHWEVVVHPIISALKTGKGTCAVVR